jgi:hypothetical protein
MAACVIGMIEGWSAQAVSCFADEDRFPRAKDLSGTGRV